MRSLTARNTSREDASPLPQALQAAVPLCAQPCVASNIQQGYLSSTCTSAGNIHCLCSHYSSSGFTLGEISLSCLRENCPESTFGNSGALYGICSGHEVAVSATHSTLTLPATATTRTGVATTTLRLTSDSNMPATTLLTTTSSRRSAVRSLRTTSAAVAATSSAASVESAVMSTSAETFSSPSATAGIAAASASSSSLTSAQAVGITLAGVGAMCLAMGIVYIVACLRRRKVESKSKRDSRQSFDFVDVSPPRFSPFNYGYKDPRGPLGGFAMPRAELSQHGRKSSWAPQRPVAVPQEIGNPPSPPMGRSVSPESVRSNGSMRTVSQLLPEKPGNTPPRPPPKVKVSGYSRVGLPSSVRPERPNRPARPLSAATAATVFEEDRSPCLASQLPVLPLPPNRTFAPPRNRAHLPQYADQLTTSPDAVGQPQLSLQIPVKRSRYDQLPTPTDFQEPVTQPTPPAALLPGPQRISTASKTRSTHNSLPPNSAVSYLPNYYTSNESRTPSILSPTPIEDKPERPKPTAIMVTKPTYPPKAVRGSIASDTSFESTDPDEPTPEESDKQLSPVVESPISGIRYPKVPRSSNQSVPRSPAPSLSPRQAVRQEQPVTPVRKQSTVSTLAAKRRGNDAAIDLERRLHITNSAYTHSREASYDTLKSRQTDPRNSLNRRSHVHHADRLSSPLKGYGKSIGADRPEMATPGPRVYRRSQDMVLRSPLWEPKLTPSRRGDDLFLSVSVATPH